MARGVGIALERRGRRPRGAFLPDRAEARVAREAVDLRGQQLRLSTSVSPGSEQRQCATEDPNEPAAVDPHPFSLGTGSGRRRFGPESRHHESRVGFGFSSRAAWISPISPAMPKGFPELPQIDPLDCLDRGKSSLPPGIPGVKPAKRIAIVFLVDAGFVAAVESVMNQRRRIRLWAR